MNLTAIQAIQIAKQYQQSYPSLRDTIVSAQFNPTFDVVGEKAWIVIGVFELFGDMHEFFYVISDETGEVEYTFNEHGTINPQLAVDMLKEW
ncbi:hypothetical protein HMPREF9714_01419 [Myroides odoratimimus CCUG 12901]|uniref:hypothetical protein n=1 Tax=Myroides odoratimimus TaxID=76832 RepID=UPI000246093D|nr:hypothetical protein [Myroides odoratimimus]EHO10990.1 hypothetical protein HMPREF9714_01419 [Myroides odoratimimus CCUG 12901]MDM1412484.1 hypothetical protein [Myroides odoratimimus]